MQIEETEWNPSRWRGFPIKQLPEWPDKEKLKNVLKEISSLPALVFAGETRSLRKDLEEAAEGKAFLLQAGDCSEDFSGCNGPRVHNLLRVILQMSVILSYAGGKKVIKVGRIAGQYAKPRSSDTETINGVSIASYKGDMVNSAEPKRESRIPNPERILEGYFRSASTLNLLRAFTSGGYASLELIRDWQKFSFGNKLLTDKYEDLINDINKAVYFSKAMGMSYALSHMNIVDFYTSHEALLLDYEEAMARIDTTTGKWYDTSAHMLWIGDRTRDHDGAHADFLSGVCNPVGVKIGPKHNIDDLKKLIDKLNPKNEKGRLTLITRLGSGQIDKYLPLLIRSLNTEGYNLVWVCDPMHGNTFTSEYSHKVRSFDDIISETKSFWMIHKAEGTIPGGLHLELTGENVTECTGGINRLTEKDLKINYQSNCDPRLNAEQAVEIAFEISDIIKS